MSTVLVFTIPESAAYCGKQKARLGRIRFRVGKYGVHQFYNTEIDVPHFYDKFDKKGNLIYSKEDLEWWFMQIVEQAFMDGFGDFDHSLNKRREVSKRNMKKRWKAVCEM